MYSRILVPLDGSELAEQVLPYVEALGKAYQVPISLLRVFDRVPPEMGDALHGVYLDQISTAFRNTAETYLEQIRTTLRTAFGGLDLPISVVSDEGDPAACIISEAEKTPGTLIAMATHGRSGITQWLLGSVTDRVLHATNCPLMMVRAKPQDEFNKKGLNGNVTLKTIIVPLDGSQVAERILPHAAYLAQGLDLPVTLLRVTNAIDQYLTMAGFPIMEGIGKMDVSLAEDMVREGDDAAMRYLQGIKAELGRLGVTNTKEIVLQGRADSVVVDLASSTPDSLVAMTTRGRSGVGRWVLGSVTDRVVRHSGDPVLVVRGAGEGAEGGVAREAGQEAAGRE